MLEFREPLLLLLAALAVPLYVIMRRPHGRMKFSGLEIWSCQVRSFRTRTSFVPPLLLALSFILFCVALSGPRVAGGVIRQKREGIAMMLVVDKSGSMAALDMSKDDKEQDRLEAIKDVLRAFILGDGKRLKGRSNDAIGLISFATFSDTDSPLTLDHVTLMQLISDLRIMTDPQESATAIGDALGLAGERLRESKAASRVVILLTDGVNNAGYLEPIEAARMLSQLGIRVYTIGVGANGFAPIRVRDFFGREVLRQMPVELDEKMLTQIAEMTGGAYFRATDRAGLERIYVEIDAMEKTLISEDRLTHYDERYASFLVWAMLCAALGFILRMTYYRRAP